jgi:hypothetical protein
MRCNAKSPRLFTDPNVAKKICSVGVSSCADLYCSHEEADTRMVLHAMNADKEFGRKNTKGVFFPTPKNEDAAGNTLHKTDLSMLYISWTGR